MFSRSGAHSVVLIEIVVGLPIFSFEVLIKLNLIQVNIKEAGRHNYNQRGGMKVRQKNSKKETSKYNSSLTRCYLQFLSTRSLTLTIINYRIGIMLACPCIRTQFYKTGVRVFL